MNIEKKEYSFKSASGLADIFVRSLMPENKDEIKGIFQIAHGMAEHGERYEGFAKVLCEAGYAVFINDHIGHGKSVENDELLGYFGENDGWKNFVEDSRTLTRLARKECPSKPLIVFGHSMGSFIARSYTAAYGNDINGAVFCGTSGKNPAADAGIALTNIVTLIKGKMYRSKFIDKIAFGSYNKKFEGRTSFDWLTRDNEIVDKYINDKYCGFLFTSIGYKDMFNLLKSVSGNSWYAAVPKDLPIMIISGENDPVGNYGKGTKQVSDDLKNSGHKNVECIIYPECRHEILNELCKQDVYDDIIEWADKICKETVNA